jgi:myo-inositol 2-dehydrogenase / D-chiro-inositol 1-dehydrogenase
MNNKLKVAVIGFWGHEIYPLEIMRHSDTELVATCDWSNESPRNGELRESTVEFGAVFCENIEDLTTKGPFDIVSINAPSRLIPDFAEKIAPHTRSLLLEKPVAADMDGARKLKAVALKHDLLVSIDYPTRFRPELKQCKAAIERGDIGKVVAGSYTDFATKGPMYSVDTSPENLKLIAGGDDTMHLGYCMLDLEYLTGSRITEVFARGGAFFYENYKKAGINDLCHINFKMENDFVGSISVGRITCKNRPPIQKMDISGNEGCLSLDYSKPLLNIYEPEKMEQVIASQTGMQPVWALVNDFVSAVASDGKASYNIDDAFHTIAVQEAVKKSLKTGQMEKVDKE